ncbi:serine/threonine-protein kinase [Micromonospora sp. NPDC049274]|uniref:serine/threonine-protein kinase n=1 Tax=Micromonospora sp. NPDC049274 TaxID=3154829 RepID=UPI00343C5D0B
MFTPLTSDDPRQISGYPLRARLGAGGMGQVYLSFTPGGRAVALKVVRREYAEDAAFRQRFAQEVQAAQRVHGVHTAQVVDAGTDAGTPWLATAYVPGPTLLAAVRDDGPLPVDTVRVMLAGVAQSLQAIHAADVVHRDLSPRNILLAADGPRVIDFGIARAVDATHLTMSQTPIGTPSFMSPEQANGTPVTPASDVFTLAAVGFFAATGRTAFGDGNYLSVLRRVAEAQADLTGCPPELRTLFEACLVRDAAARPTTAHIIEACGGVPRFGADWLPKPVAATVAAHGAALASIIAEPAGSRPEVTTAPPSAAVPGPSRPRNARRVLLATTLGVVLLAGGVGIGIAMRPDSTGDRTGSADTGGSTTAAAAGPSASAPTTPASPTPTASAAATPRTPAVQWTGPVRIGGRGIDLDPVPPAVDPEVAEMDAGMPLPGPVIRYGDASTMAMWSGGAKPTFQQCRELVSTQGTTELRVARKDVVCLKTDQARIVLLVIDSVTSDGAVGIGATATVWDRASDS